MSAIGPKQTSLVAPHMSAFGGKSRHGADVGGRSRPVTRARADHRAGGEYIIHSEIVRAIGNDSIGKGSQNSRRLRAENASGKHQDIAQFARAENVNRTRHPGGHHLLSPILLV